MFTSTSFSGVDRPLPMSISIHVLRLKERLPSCLLNQYGPALLCREYTMTIPPVGSLSAWDYINKYRIRQSQAGIQAPKTQVDR